MKIDEKNLTVAGMVGTSSHSIGKKRGPERSVAMFLRGPNRALSDAQEQAPHQQPNKTGGERDPAHPISSMCCFNSLVRGPIQGGSQSNKGERPFFGRLILLCFASSIEKPINDLPTSFGRAGIYNFFEFFRLIFFELGNIQPQLVIQHAVGAAPTFPDHLFIA